MHASPTSRKFFWRDLAHVLAQAAHSLVQFTRSLQHSELYRRGGRWIISGQELADGRLIHELAEQWRFHAGDTSTRPKLLAYRNDFRRIASRGSIAGLLTCIDDPNLRCVRLAIWLMGRTHSKLAISEVTPFASHADPSIRREAVRTLRRLGAWPRLISIALLDLDPRVRRLAIQRPPKSFDQRFTQLARSVCSVAVPTSDAPDPLLAPSKIGPRRLPKSAAIIRGILERIRRVLSE